MPWIAKLVITDEVADMLLGARPELQFINVDSLQLLEMKVQPEWQNSVFSVAWSVDHWSDACTRDLAKAAMSGLRVRLHELSAMTPKEQLEAIGPPDDTYTHELEQWPAREGITHA